MTTASASALTRPPTRALSIHSRQAGSSRAATAAASSPNRYAAHGQVHHAIARVRIDLDDPVGVAQQHHLVERALDDAQTAGPSTRAPSTAPCTPSAAAKAGHARSKGSAAVPIASTHCEQCRPAKCVR